jgi:hypothetical protein
VKKQLKKNLLQFMDQFIFQEEQKMVDVNTVSRYPTHFLRAVELLTIAREEFKIQSENWPYPIEDRFGIPNDRYYAEIWVDGMDWQPSYWVIEEKELDKPIVYPFIVFHSNNERSKFHNHDFSELIKAALWYRRDLYFIKQKDYGYYTDMVWPFLTISARTKWSKFPHLMRVSFEHASQPKVEFFMNVQFIPKSVLERVPNENNRHCGNQEARYGICVQSSKKEVL